MINEKLTQSYCNSDITQIENYDIAISDATQTWHCHHRKETDDGLSRKQLIELELYYDRPANELIFLTPFVHKSLHNKDRVHTDIARKNMSESHKGKTKSEETKHKMSEANKGKHKSEETKQRISKSLKGIPKSEEWKLKKSESMKGNKKIVKDGKGAYCKPEELEYYLNNGWQLQKYKKKE